MSSNAANLPLSPRADMLGEKGFLLAVVAAVALHAIGLYAWSLMPRQQVLDIPVHPLDIKLGDGDATPVAQEQIKAVQPDAGNAQAIEKTLTKISHDQNPQVQARTQNMVHSIDKAVAPRAAAPILDKAISGKGFDLRPEGVAASAPVMPVATAQQYVRDVAPSEELALASPTTANPTSKDRDATTVVRYEQNLSQWIEKYKVYPEDARKSGMQGSTLVRIRVDRRGNVRYYALERSTGFPALDRAALDMIRRANPVPAFPRDYPAGDLFEFLVPVNFQLQ